MLNISPKRIIFVLALSVLFILSASTSPSFAGKGESAVVVVNYVQDGSVVHVTVRNTSKRAQTVNVFVDAMVGSEAVRGFTPVSIFGNGTAVTVVGFSERVESVETVGINETDSPF